MTGKEKQRKRAAARTCAGDPKRCCTTQGNSHQKKDKERYERDRDRAGVPFYTAKYHNASEIVMQIGKRNKLKQKTENLNLNFLSMEFNAL